MIHKQILKMQWVQFNHDELYHREIARLNVADRMKHITLHLAKYSGQILEADRDNDKKCYQDNLVDTFIISLSGANVVNLDLGRAITIPDACVTNLGTLGHYLLSSRRQKPFDNFDFKVLFPVLVGRLAKACESLDHVEAYAFRENMHTLIREIFEIVVIESARLKIDMSARAQTRLDSVRSKHMFDGFLRSQLTQVNEGGMEIGFLERREA